MSEAAPAQIIPPNIRQMPDGRLVLVGGNHNVQIMFAADGPGVGDAQVAVFMENHRNRMAWCAERGIGYGQWIFPDPILFSGVLPAGTVRSVVTRALPDGARPDAVHYPFDSIDGHADRQSRTDSHYSPIGNMHLAARIARQMQGLDTAPELARLEAILTAPVAYTGDSGVQCTPAISETRSRAPQMKGIRTASNGVQAGNMGIMQLLVSPQATSDRTLLIFGDSFFRALLPELARYWRRIVFCRTPFFHAEMVAAIAPDDILCGLAERYFATTQPDRNRPHFLAFPLMLGRATAPDANFAELWAELVNQQALVGA